MLGCKQKIMPINDCKIIICWKESLKLQDFWMNNSKDELIIRLFPIEE